ncbi:hypothetical protein V7087_28470 [Neobacillus niacini]|uniref:hypothetical protein n=1 Tax=Neobacillus niacini TaxID=86668 RepID=UPI0030003B95
MMIKEMDIRCHFYGEKFSPKVVEKLIGITLKNKIEVGDISNRGRNKGKPADYGNGELCPPKDFKDNEDFGLYWIALTLSKHIDIFRKCGAENIDLVIGVWNEKQCNLVFKPESIKLIGELGIPLQVSCYEDY